MNLKVFNDPIYGFVSLPFPLIAKLIDHPYFQRLRRIQQLGMTNLVYPGALHTRFHHALGAMHLMGEALEVLRSKGVSISDEEARAVQIAILLHDIGHGPFSHSLEFTLIEGVNHEHLTGVFMRELDREFSGELKLAIQIFQNKYKKKFLHQLVSGQLDMDRLDYLSRDSFYTGVAEGVVSTHRIIKMLNVHGDQLVIDSKGIYSVEKFIIARRLMYWQVYMHKTAVAGEKMLINTLKRAKDLSLSGSDAFAAPALKYFLSQKLTTRSFTGNSDALEWFARLDDYDVLSAVKVWESHPDSILSNLSKGLINRKLFKIRIQKQPIGKKIIAQIEKKAQKLYGLRDSEVAYFVVSGELENNAYRPMEENIYILAKNKQVADIAKVSDNLNLTALSAPVRKYFVCCPEACLKGVNI